MIIGSVISFRCKKQSINRVISPLLLYYLNKVRLIQSIMLYLYKGILLTQEELVNIDKD